MDNVLEQISLAPSVAPFKPTSRTRVRRKPARGSYDRELIHEILDRALICHVAFVSKDQPYAMPTIHARRGDTLYLHGSNGSRMLRVAAAGEPLCVTATVVDGIVLARSVFHHSLNYRSAVVIGSGRRVVDEREKRTALEMVVEHIVPGRAADARGPTAKELRATTVVAIELEEASAKVRTGPPVDDLEDLQLSVWAGVVPLAVVPGAPVPDEKLDGRVALPRYVARWRSG
ncbi:MAG: pyridoxamine 5'-phosphate oxidase family protein [Solirubrobacterales bacterium]|nr:pyridoxamine 5'-phosphate oxidase family protein [Solirubrobacterales bacterium]